LKPLARNYKIAVREIDIIMLDGDIIVFIEVHARSNDIRMKTIETISQEKYKRIIKVSNHYL